MDIEWKNGDECVYMSHKVIHQFIGEDPKREGYGYIQATGYEVNFVELSKLSKPETQQQREERELCENIDSAYDLAPDHLQVPINLYVAQLLLQMGYRKQ